MVSLLIALAPMAGPCALAGQSPASDGAKVEWQRKALAKDLELKNSGTSYLSVNDIAFLKRGERVFLDLAARHEQAKWLKTAPKTLNWISLENHGAEALIRDSSGRDKPLLFGQIWSSPNGLTVRVSGGDVVWAYLHDPKSPKLLAFKGLDRFPYNPDAVLKAEFVPMAQPAAYRFATTRGQDRPAYKAGRLEISLSGKRYELDAFAWSDGPQTRELFVPFRDASNGKQSYGGGRYVDVPLSRGLRPGALTVDFNDAYNPLCARSPFYDCVLYPENKLPVAILAGEKVPRGAH